MGEDPGGTIWALNRRTKHRSRVAAQPFFPYSHPCLTISCTPSLSFDLEGNTLVWSNFHQGRQPDWMASSIRERKLPRGKVHTLYEFRGHCEMQTDPRVAGGDVVWIKARWPRDVTLADLNPPQQCEGSMQTDVMSARIHKPGHPRQLTHDHLASDPDTNGSWVTWRTWQGASNPCACYSLNLRKLSGGPLKLLSTDASDSLLTPHLAVWIQESPQQTAVLALNLGNHTQVAVSEAGSVTSANPIRALAHIRGDRVVWERDVVHNPYNARAIVGLRRVS